MSLKREAEASWGRAISRPAAGLGVPPIQCELFAAAFLRPLGVLLLC